MREVEVTPSYPHQAQVTHPLQDQTSLQKSGTFAYLAGLFCALFLLFINKRLIWRLIITHIMVKQKSLQSLANVL